MTVNFFGKDLVKLHHSSFACSIKNGGYCLESKQGKVVFVLPAMVTENINLHVKKNSGNGVFEVNGQKLTCYSKDTEVIPVIYNDNKIEISRPSGSLGEISIVGFSLDSPTESLNEKDHMANNWKAIINRCGDFKGIKLLGNKVYAVEGAKFAEAKFVEEIKTIPDNAVAIVNGELVFHVGCEIIHLKASSELLSKTSAIIQHREEPPAPVLNKPYSFDLTKTLQKTSIAPISQNDSLVHHGSYSQLVIYDSKKSLDKIHLNSNNKLTKHLNSNNQHFIAIKKGGSFDIPFSELRKGGSYIVILTAQKLSGNGRLYVGFSSDNQSQFSSTTIDSTFLTKSIQLTLPVSYSSPKLQINMLEDCVGEILIKQIVVLEDLPTVNRFALIKEMTKRGSVKHGSVYPQTDVRESTRKSTKFSLDPQNHLFEFNSIIESDTFSGKQWIVKNLPFVKGIRVKDSKNSFWGGVSFSEPNEKSNFLFSSITSLKKPHDNLYLDPWDSKVELKKEIIAILNQGKRIVVGSRANFFYLKDRLNHDLTIDYLSKPILAPDAKESSIKENYLVYFEKNELVTRALLDLWQTTMPNLCVVGSNLDGPIFVKKISEFLPWSKISSLILNSAGLLDLDLINSKSSINDLAIGMNVPIITSNSEYLEKSHAYLSCELDQINGVVFNTDILFNLAHILPNKTKGKRKETSESELISKFSEFFCGKGCP